MRHRLRASVEGRSSGTRTNDESDLRVPFVLTRLGAWHEPEPHFPVQSRSPRLVEQYVAAAADLQSDARSCPVDRDRTEQDLADEASWYLIAAAPVEEPAAEARASQQ